MNTQWSKNPFFRFKPYNEYLKLTVDQILDYYNFWYGALDISKSYRYNDFIRKHIVSAWAALWDVKDKSKK